MVHQSTSSSEPFYFLFPQAFLVINFIIFQLQLIIFITTHQLYDYLLTVFLSLLSLKSSDSSHLVSEFLAISYWFLDAKYTGYDLLD